jgi:hypothetical protein
MTSTSRRQTHASSSATSPSDIWESDYAYSGGLGSTTELRSTSRPKTNSTRGTAANCAAIPAYEYYGTDGYGNVSTASELHLKNGSTWGAWTDANTFTYSFSPYHYNKITGGSDWSAFKTDGS